MKKGIEWLKDKIRAERERLALSLSEGQETMREFILNNGKHGALVDVLELIDQLDEPEVTLDEPEILSQEWVHENKEMYLINDTSENAVPAYKLQNLLVPKQEELETKIQELIESYKQEEDAYSNPENGWISGFIEDLKSLVEDEQKYNVKFKVKSSFGSVGIFLYKKGDEVLAGDNFKAYYPEEDKFRLTEQEIKDFDPRYWEFRKPV